jgi:hypothetical protein
MFTSPDDRAHVFGAPMFPGQALDKVTEVGGARDNGLCSLLTLVRFMNIVFAIYTNNG